MFPHLAAGAVSEVSTVTNEANWLLENAWLIALLPAISFVLILFFGKKMPFKGAEFGITAVSISFILAILTGAAWMDHRDNFTLDTYGEKAAVLSTTAQVPPSTTSPLPWASPLKRLTAMVRPMWPCRRPPSGCSPAVWSSTPASWSTASA